ncbi:MAG: putative rane protein [Edaphobacter sp.]|nr:putative rane protein [Edaphobacter sp.]
MLKSMSARNLFYIGIIVSASGLIGPPFALAAGLVFGLTTVHHFHVESRQLSKFLLQAAVVCLGFGMNLQEVVHAGRSGFLYTAISITFALSLGVLLGKMLKVGKTQSLLISFGTAICGGSAIAAMGPVLEANEEEMAVSMGTVFVLNSVALLLFPFIGLAMHLSQTQFGLWAALAIHDTSSVVGAGAKYGATALAVGTTVKLARALWIVPLAIATAMLKKSKAKVHWPWFILYFCAAAVLASYAPRYVPQTAGLFAALNKLGRSGLTVVLFLIGTGITRSTLREVGVRPLVQGVALWVVVASLSLWAIHVGWIAL